MRGYVNLERRLVALERLFYRESCGPGFPPQALELIEQDGRDAKPVLEEGQAPPATCPRFGRCKTIRTATNTPKKTNFPQSARSR
jgi:hypothetical protein